MKYPVIDSSSAIKKFNKNVLGFQEIQSRLRPQEQPQLMTSEKPLSLNDYLIQEGKPATFSVKMAIAKQVGMPGYVGTPEQDQAILVGIQGLNQKKADRQKFETETSLKNKEFGLKEKELGIKEKEIGALKPPTADEIAGSIVNRFNQT